MKAEQDKFNPEEWEIFFQWAEETGLSKRIGWSPQQGLGANTGRLNVYKNRDIGWTGAKAQSGSRFVFSTPDKAIAYFRANPA